NHSDKPARAREKRAVPATTEEKSLSISSDLEKAKWHRKERTKPWIRFERYCHQKSGPPRLSGFITWLGKIKSRPQPKRDRPQNSNGLTEHLDTEHLKHLSDEEREDRSRRRAHIRRF